MKRKRLRGWVAAFLSVLLLGAGVTVDAAEVKNFSLSINEVTAVPGDTVAFNVDVTDNPGIMAMTVSFCYDPAVLEFDSYYPGLFGKDTLADHGNYVSLVHLARRDVTEDGTLFGMRFHVRDDAPAGKTVITIKNIHPTKYGTDLTGCFANWEGDKLVPRLTPGSITVSFNGKNCKHRFGSWETTVPPACTAEGAKTRSCNICGHTELAPIPAAGHQYDENWTVDRAAEDNRNGQMSRHCLHCDGNTDTVTFTVADAAGNGFANAVGTVLKPGSWQPLKKTETPKQEENPPEPIPEKEPEITEEEPEKPIQNAVEMVETVRKTEKKSTLQKIREFFFGGEKTDGIFEIIIHSLPAYFYIVCGIIAVAFVIALLII